jgi:hypothetical protein
VKGISDFKRFGWLSFAIVAGYFIVGLWPFAFRPPNHVSWLADRAGLHFETSGVAFDPASLSANETNSNNSQSANFTVELWAEADREPGDNVYDLLTIHNPGLPTDFVLCQWQRSILLRATIQHPLPHKISEVGVENVLLARKSLFITVRGDGAGTDFFLDGMPAEHFPQFILKPGNLDGQLILGNDDSGKHPWNGRLFGLALFHRTLEAGEIAGHHALWTQGRTRQLTNAPGLTALYLFDEGGGRQAEDFSGNRHHVIIPEIFQAVHKQFLIPPWRELAYGSPDYSDIVVNILGFIPFGFCFFLHRQSVRANAQAANFLFVIFAGAVVSLTIELIQAWLPNRESSMTDLLTNIFGTLIGVVLALFIQHKVMPANTQS